MKMIIWFPAFLIFVFMLIGCSGKGDRTKEADIYKQEDGWESLYNGKNLDGWRVECQPQDRSKNHWQARDGYIECNSLGQPDHNYIWLMSDNEYDDFQLRLEFQAFRESTGNSGVQFRSRFNVADAESGGGWLNGPQDTLPCNYIPVMKY